MKKILSPILLVLILTIFSPPLLGMSPLKQFLQIVEEDPCFSKYSIEALQSCVENNDSRYIQTALDLTKCHLHDSGEKMVCCTGSPEYCVKKLEGHSWKIFSGYVIQLKKACNQGEQIPQTPIGLEIFLSYFCLLLLHFILRKWHRDLTRILMICFVLNVLIELLIVLYFPKTNFVMTTLERALTAFLVGKFANWHLEGKVQRELANLNPQVDSHRALLHENTNLLQKLLRKGTKLIAAAHAANPSLPRDDLSVSEQVILEKVEDAPKKGMSLATIPEVD